MAAPVALGIRPHTGWAVAVAVSGAGDAVSVEHRARLELCAAGDPPQPWHAARSLGLSPDEAAALDARVLAGARVAARDALRSVLDAVDGVVAAVVLGEPRDIPDPATVLANHMLLHAAEGELFRLALVDAAEDAGLDVWLVHPKAVDVTRHEAVLAAVGRRLGPPWRADHRLAAAAALDVLAARR